MIKKIICACLVSSVMVGNSTSIAQAKTEITYQGCLNVDLKRHYNIDLEQVPGIISKLAWTLERLYADYHTTAAEYQKQYGTAKMTEMDKTAAKYAWEELDTNHPLKQTVQWLQDYSKNWNSQGKVAAQNNLKSVPYWVSIEQMEQLQKEWDNTDIGHKKIRPLVEMLVYRKPLEEIDLMILMMWALGGTREDLYKTNSGTKFPSEEVFYRAWYPAKGIKFAHEEFWVWQEVSEIGISYYLMDLVGGVAGIPIEYHCDTPLPSTRPVRQVPPALAFNPNTMSSLSSYSKVMKYAFSS